MTTNEIIEKLSGNGFLIPRRDVSIPVGMEPIKLNGNLTPPTDLYGIPV